MSDVSKPIIITTEDKDKAEAKDLIQKAMSNSLVLCVENESEFAIIRGSSINFVIGHGAEENNIDMDEKIKSLEGVRISIEENETISEDNNIEVN